MTNIRRYFVPGAPVFITAVCHRRYPYLKNDEHKTLLLSVMREVKAERPFCMLGFALLDEHFHWLIVPAEASDMPRIMQSVKLRFARRLPQGIRASAPHVWQRRYWDHVIRDKGDLQAHLDYLHLNPVRHGAVQAAGDYRWSSFNRYLARGWYAPDWGRIEDAERCEGLVPE